MKMKNFIFPLVILFSLATSCNVEEDLNSCYNNRCTENELCVDGKCVKVVREGFESENQPRPVKVILDNFTVTKFPVTRPGGINQWDQGSGPDLYIRILQGANILFETPMSITDASSVPISVMLTAPLEITSFSSDIVVNMYDDDGNKTDEFMGGAFESVYDGSSGYPDILNVNRGQTNFQFNLRYEF